MNRTQRRPHHSRAAVKAVLILAVSALFLGCESELNQAAELSLETRNALDVLPTDVRMVGAFDLVAARTNALAAEALSDERLMPREGREAYQYLSEFLSVTGFDPQEDLHSIYVAARPDDNEGAMNLVAYADVDRDRMRTYFDEHQAGEFTRSDYQDTPVYRHSKDDAHTLFLALPNDEMLIAGSSESSLHAMLDNLAGSGRGLSSNEALMALIDRVPREGGWMVVQDPFSGAEFGDDAEGEDQEMARLAPMIQDMIVATEFREGGIQFEMILKTKPSYEAGDVADVMRGVVATAKGAAKQDAEAIDLLDRVKIRDRGDEVRASAYLDDATLTRLRGEH